MGKKYKVGACGNFHQDNSFLNGQVIRSQTIMKELEKKLSSDQVTCLSYHNWKRRPFSLMINFIRLLIQCKNLLLFPDMRAIHVLVPLAVLLKNLFHTKVFYNVIGGWIVEYIENQPRHIKLLNKLDGLFVQTASLQRALQAVGISRVTVLPNFKYIKIYKEDELPDVNQRPYRLVFMSRIVGKKGVTQLINTIEKINRNRKETLFTLDIYGSVQEEYKDEFRLLMERAPDYIQYCGQVDPNQTSTVMIHYFLHVFPTLYKTEGFPGSILDAFCGGCPTLAAAWDSYDDVITDGSEGFSFELGNWDDFEDKLLWASEHPEEIIAMRKNCLKKGSAFSPDQIIQIMLEALDLDC